MQTIARTKKAILYSCLPVAALFVGTITGSVLFRDNGPVTDGPAVSLADHISTPEVESDQVSSRDGSPCNSSSKGAIAADSDGYIIQCEVQHEQIAWRRM